MTYQPSAFGTIAVAGQDDVVADAANQALTLVAGTNVTLTTDDTTDSVTINATGGGGGITALTGDVTASGTGSVTATIAADAVTNAKLADMPSLTLKGNNTGGAANPLDLTAAQAKSLLAITNADVSGLGTLATQNGTFSGTSSGTNTGDNAVNSLYSGLVSNATHSGDAVGATALTIQPGVVTLAKMANLAANSLIGNNTGSPATPLALTTTQVKTLLAIANTDVSGLGTLATQSGTFSGTSSGTNTGDQTITLTSDVTGSGVGSFAATIANDAVTYAKMQNVSAASRLLGRGDSGSGDVQEITLGANLTMTGTTLAATGGGGISDGDKGDITVTASGATWTIDNDVVTYAKMQNASAGNVVLARAAATSGDYSEVAVGASQLVGRGSTGDVAAITLGSGLSMSGTTISASGGSSDIVGAAAPISLVPVNNSTTHQTLATKTITVAVGDQIEITVIGSFLNNSGATVTPNVRFTLGSFNVDVADGATSAANATNRSLWRITGTWSVFSVSSVIFGGETTHGTAAALGTAMSTALATNRSIVQTSGSNLTGSVACTVGFRSSTNTATQSFTVHNWIIRKTGTV